MAHYKATVRTTAGHHRAFALMADFGNASGWDPATFASRKLTDGPIGVGTRFALDMQIFGRKNQIEYEVTEYQPPHRVVLRGENAGSVSVDEISVEPAGSASEVTYEARVTMKGPYKLIGPLFGPVFRRMGDEARDRIGPWLDSQAAEGN